MERYVDEKHPDVVYEFIPVIESAQPRPQRPLWRRFIRVTLMVWGMLILVNTLYHATTHTCGKPQHKSIVNTDSPPLLDYTFDPEIDNFWVKQESFNAGITRTEVIGRVIVASCPKAENISAHFKIDSTDDDLKNKITIEPKKDGILFKLDPFSLVKQQINATVFLVIPEKDDYKLKRFRATTIQLDVWLKESFTTAINSTTITTVSGNVGSRGHGDNLLDINNLKVSSVSGGIYGDFPLQHSLFLQTTSGDIKAHVDSADRREQKAWFKTETVSGNTTAVFVGDLHPRPLYSKHTSVSGPIQIYYPEDWQGGLKIETTSGSIDVEGEGTKIVKKEKGLTKKLWEVIKGDGKSKGYIGTVGGNIDIGIGKLDKE